MKRTRRRAVGSRGAGRAGAPPIERLWAPWRMAFVSGARAPSGCLFCRVAAGHADRAHLVVERRPNAILMLNRYPYAPGHLMVAVTRHVGTFAGLTSGERDDLLGLAALGERLLKAEYRPHGLNAGANLGRVAGAGFPGHLHLHLVPRWNGDTNFMLTLGATRVLPESLDASWRRLRRVRGHVAPVRGAGGRRPSGPGAAGPGRRPVRRRGA